MRNTTSSSFVLSSLFLFVGFGVAACSVESTSPPSTGTEKPASTAPATEPSEPPTSSKPPPSKPTPAPEEDPPTKTPPKPFFEATLDGSPTVFDETSIELDDDTYELQGIVHGKTPYESDSTLTVRIEKGETGAGVCSSGKRSVNLWYKDETAPSAGSARATSTETAR